MATLLEEYREKYRNVCHCSLCSRIFKIPKMLPCLHSFCEACLEDYINTSTINKSEDAATGIKCPECRIFIDMSKDIGYKDWVKELPTNHLLNELIVRRNTEGGHSQCNICEEKSKHRIASHLCIACNVALCESCNRSHETARFKDLSLSTLDNNRLCRDHNEKYQFYCSNHSEICCNICVKERHQDCQHVDTVEKAAQDAKESYGEEFLVAELANLKEICQTMIKNKDQDATKLAKKLATTRSVVKKLYDDVVCHLTKATSATLYEIDECEKQHLQRMLDEKMDMECKVAGLDKNLDFLRITSEYASTDQYLYIMKTLSEQKQSFDTLLERMLDNHETTDIHFTPDTNLSRILEESESIGNISVFRKKEEKTDKKAVSHSAQAASSMKQNKSFHKPTESCTKPIKPCDDMEALVMVGEDSARIGSMSKLISTKTWIPSLVKSDIEDSIMGAAMLGPDRMLLSMRKKKSLALIDGEGRQLDSLSLSHETWGLRMIAPTEGAVVVYDKCLQFFNVIANKIVKRDSLNVPVRRDFAFHRDIYYIGGDKNIMVYDRSHRLLRDITVSGTVRSIAIRDDSSLYYTVYLESNLYCITMEGTPVFTYSHQKLNWTAGITVDPASNIYICGCSSRNVHQLSNDGKLQRIIFENLPADPYCISFNTQGDKALIGCADKVLLYEFN